LKLSLYELSDELDFDTCSELSRVLIMLGSTQLSSAGLQLCEIGIVALES